MLPATNRISLRMSRRGGLLLTTVAVAALALPTIRWSQSVAAPPSDQVGSNGDDAAGQPPKVVVPNFVVRPILTDFQRQWIAAGDKDVSACVFVDATSFLNSDGRIAPDGLDLNAIADALSPYVTGKTAMIHVDYGNGKVPNNTRDFFVFGALERAARQSGFANVRITNAFRNVVGVAWQKRIAPVIEQPADETKDESPVVNDFVRAYPVRTALSRFVSESDCVCYIEKPLGSTPDAAAIPTEVQDAIKAAVSKLTLDRKRSVAFRFLTKTEKDRAAATLFIDNGSMTLAKSLGFEQGVVSISY